jgi:hypothetical protein
VVINVTCATSLKSCGYGVEKARSHGDALSDPSLRLQPVSFVRNTNSRIKDDNTGRGHSRPDEPTLPSRPPQNIGIRSKLTGEVGVVCAIFRSDFDSNFVSHRIARRLNLTSYIDPSASTSTLAAAGTEIIPTYKYCDLVLTTRGYKEPNSHRFYIVKDGPLKFDIMLGSAFAASHSHSSPRIQLAELIRPIP